MSDFFNENGLTLATLTEIRNKLITEMRNIYGQDISLDSNTPDGQFVNIDAQAGINLREILKELDESFNLWSAKGRILDQRVALINVKRKSGTFTTTQCHITTNNTNFVVNLQGLDDQSSELEPTNNPFTISDEAGNLFYLQNSITINSAETTEAIFRSSAIGQVIVAQNSLVRIITTIKGVVAVNNPLPADLGRNGQSDIELRNHAWFSIGNGSLGWVDSIVTNVLQIESVEDCRVYENVDTSPQDENGIPINCIWVIVDGDQSDTEKQAIGQVIKVKRAGGGMKGDVVVNVPRLNNQIFVAKFDYCQQIPIYLKMSLTIRNSSDNLQDISDFIKRLLVAEVVYRIGDSSNISDFIAPIVAYNKDIDTTDVKISIDNTNWLETIQVPSIDSKFVLSIDNIELT